MTIQRSWLTYFALAFALAACGDSDNPAPATDASVDTPDIIVEEDVAGGDYTGDRTWVTGKTYTLKGYVFITSGTLTIQPGATIKGDNASALVITREAKINAVGTATQPIVFTSSKASPTTGDWGGVVLLGKSTINVSGGQQNIEGLTATPGQTKTLYGGGATPVPDHDCGKLSYARIEYAGFELAPMNELNGLTLGGCGSATVVDFVQVHRGRDDGVEVFGGSVKLRHIVISQPDDDGLDIDLGWTGDAQFVVIQQNGTQGDKGFEFDNHPMMRDAMPRSAPNVWNVTVIGGDGPATGGQRQGGLHLRNGVAGSYNNMVVTYFNRFTVDVDGQPSASRYGTELSIKNTYFWKATAQTEPWPVDFDVTGGVQNDPLPAGGFLDEKTVICGEPTNRCDVDPMLTAPKSLTAPNFKPMTGSPMLTGCGTPPAGMDTTATFCGAIGATDWTAGWTRYP